MDLARNLELEMALPFVDDFGQLGALFATVDLTARVGGQVDLHMENGEPSLVGELRVIDGTVDVLRSNLALEEGAITFTGGNPAEQAQLDLKARMDVEGGSLTMAITGTPYEPVIELHSDEYPDETAQITMLLTGEAPDDLSADEGASALAGVLMGSVLGGADLGNVSIESDGSTKVTVPINQRVRAASTVSPFPEPQENRYTLQVEWTLSPQLVLSGSLGDVISSVDLFLELRF